MCNMIICECDFMYVDISFNIWMLVYGYINQCVTMWLRTVDSLDHNMGLWLTPQSRASFVGTKAGAARLWMRPLVCRCYIQWLYNVCVACGTYVVNWMYFIISKQMVIILYVEVIQSVLMCYCKRRKCIPLSIYTLMTSLLMS
jgi:hypothetical protein